VLEMVDVELHIHFFLCPFTNSITEQLLLVCPA